MRLLGILETRSGRHEDFRKAHQGGNYLGIYTRTGSVFRAYRAARDGILSSS